MTTAEPELAAFREELERVRSRLAQAHVGEDERVDLAAHESDLLEAIALEEDLLGVGKAGEEGKKSSEQSVEELTRAADERNLDPEAKRALERASKALEENRAEDCLKSLKHCLRVDPTCFQASLQCGMLLANKGDNDAALEYFERTVRTQPGCLTAYIAMSQVLQQVGRIEEAEVVLKQVCGFAFDHPEVWSALSRVLFRQGKLEEAVDTIKFAMKGGPEGKFKKPSRDPMVLFCLAYFLACLGHIAEPCSLFLRICNDDPSPVSLYLAAQTCRLASDADLGSKAVKGLLSAYESSRLAFCSELAVFNATFAAPQWEDAISGRRREEKKAGGTEPSAEQESRLRIRGKEVSLRFLACVDSCSPLRASCGSGDRAWLSMGSEEEEESVPFREVALALEGRSPGEGGGWPEACRAAREAVEAEVAALAAEIVRPKGQARQKRFAGLGLTKILSIEVAVGQDFRSWVTRVDGAPRLGGGGAGEDPVVEAVVHATGRQIFDGTLREITEGAGMRAEDQKLFSDYQAGAKTFENF